MVLFAWALPHYPVQIPIIHHFDYFRVNYALLGFVSLNKLLLIRLIDGTLHIASAGRAATTATKTNDASEILSFFGVCACAMSDR